MRATKATLIRALEEANTVIRIQANDLKNATELAKKAWEEHRFAVEQIGRASKEAEAWRQVAQTSVDVARNDMRARCAEALEKVGYKDAAGIVLDVPLKP